MPIFKKNRNIILS